MKPSSCISYYPSVPNLPGMKDTEMERDMECLLGELTDNTSKMKFQSGGLYLARSAIEKTANRKPCRNVP
jgi:hypothetical protein